MQGLVFPHPHALLMASHSQVLKNVYKCPVQAPDCHPKVTDLGLRAAVVIRQQRTGAIRLSHVKCLCFPSPGGDRKMLVGKVFESSFQLLQSSVSSNPTYK